MEEKIIYIFSDESGTFDRYHNAYFLFGGLIFFDKEKKDIAIRKFAHVEKIIRSTSNKTGELKACLISNSQKGKLYRSLKQEYKFCVLIKQKDINYRIFDDKKSKQRYLDYAYKIVIKKCMETLIENSHIAPKFVKFIIVNADEHHTATNGLYELKESMVSEFKTGAFNKTWDIFYEPIFPQLSDIVVRFCDSSKNYLVRAADIVSNHCYHKAIENDGDLSVERNMFIYYLPGNNVGHTGLEYFDSSQEE